jgi:hypothetical protein
MCCHWVGKSNASTYPHTAIIDKPAIRAQNEAREATRLWSILEYAYGSFILTMALRFSTKVIYLISIEVQLYSLA